MIRAAVAWSLALLACLSGVAAAEQRVDPVHIVRTYPHDRGAFTEGLFFRDGKLFESTGLEGKSDIREVRLEDGKVLRRVAIPPQLFGEGIIDVGDEIVSVTWQTGVGFRWSYPALKQKARFTYPGEGWGMTRIGRQIVLSDGTPVLRVLDPIGFKLLRTIRVTTDGRPVLNLNELEYVRGEILANIWQTNLIARIDPASGHVTGWLDVSALPRPPAGAGAGQDSVPNGIAYDATSNRLFVTGKNWPNLYEISVPAK